MNRKRKIVYRLFPAKNPAGNTNITNTNSRNTGTQRGNVFSSLNFAPFILNLSLCNERFRRRIYTPSQGKPIRYNVQQYSRNIIPSFSIVLPAGCECSTIKIEKLQNYFIMMIRGTRAMQNDGSRKIRACINNGWKLNPTVLSESGLFAWIF